VYVCLCVLTATWSKGMWSSCLSCWFTWTLSPCLSHVLSYNYGMRDFFSGLYVHIATWLFCSLPTPAVWPPAWVGRSVASVCQSVCLFVRALKKTAWAINTELGTHILYSSSSACIDPEVKIKGQGHTVTKTVTVAWLLVTGAVTALCCAAGVGLHVDTTACVF